MERSSAGSLRLPYAAALVASLELSDGPPPKRPRKMGLLRQEIGAVGHCGQELLYGESNAGKTGLTRPLIHIFGDRTFLRPNRGDTFPLQGLEQHLVGVWQDWRLATSPIPWDTLLLLLEGESVSAAVKGGAPVIVHHPPPFIITSQGKVVPKTAKGEPGLQQ